MKYRHLEPCWYKWASVESVTRVTFVHDRIHMIKSIFQMVLYRNIDQTPVNSLHGLLNWWMRLSWYYNRVFISCPLSTHVTPTICWLVLIVQSVSCYSLYVVVAKKNLAFVQDQEEHACIDIETVNPRLYEHVPEMLEIQVNEWQIQVNKWQIQVNTC